MEAPKNIIVKMPNWLGDLVMATPVLAELRKKWPDATITAMCQMNVAPLLTHDPHIDELFSYQKPSGWIPHLSHWNLIRSLQQGNYDLGVLLTNSFSTAWWFLLGGIKTRIGYAGNLRNWLLTYPVPFPKEKESQHQVLTYKMVLKPLGIPVSDEAPRLYITSEEHQAADNLLKSCGIIKGENPIVGINPGAAYGSAKCWPAERFRAVTEKLLQDPNLYVLYFGDLTTAPMVHAICKDFPERVIDLSGKTTLRELLALINSCSVFLTNDSGPMHIASALNVPLVALFGSTSAVKTGPYAGGTVIHKHVECSPCYKRVCPIDFRCMMRISVEEVYEELQKLLK